MDVGGREGDQAPGSEDQLGAGLFACFGPYVQPCVYRCTVA